MTDDPFAPRQFPSSGLDAPEESIAGQELDPLELLDLVPEAARRREKQSPSAKDLERGSPLDKHFQPPDAVLPAPAPLPHRAPRSDPIVDSPRLRSAGSGDCRFILAARSSPPAPPLPSAPAHTGRSRSRPRRRLRPSIPPPPVDARGADAAASRASGAGAVTGPCPRAGTDQPSAADFAAVLAGAGLDPADVTPELARTFGQILRVVVSGVMDVMRSRQQIKDEFRMRMTHFRPAENNPLKFSANVDDALHNLLVKRNAAYLAPVEAFEDAFADLRNHQIAMLAGMRVAFESMLAEFDPDRLQQEFDRQLEQGPDAGEASLLGSLSGKASRDGQGPGSELPPLVRRGVRAGVRRAAQAAQGQGRAGASRESPAEHEPRDASVDESRSFVIDCVAHGTSTARLPRDCVADANVCP